MARLYYAKLQAVLDADISAGATTVTFTAPLREWGEDNIATITAPDILAMWVGNELIHITAYTSGASTATVLRGQEGSTATTHSEGDILRHDATATDYELFSAGSPTETIQDIVGAMVTGGTETGIAVTYDDTNGRLDFVAEVTQSELDAKANDADVVHDAGNETIAGVKAFSSAPIIPDEAYDATAWNGSLEPPTKNAVRDKIESLGGASVSDAAYGSGWNGDTTTAPSKNSVYDKIETLGAGGSVATDTIFDAKGDLPAGTGADTAAKLTAGSNGHVLKADSAETTGLKWAPAEVGLDDLSIFGGSPSSEDYEFGATTTSLPSGWSWVNQGARTYNEVGGRGQLLNASAGGTEWWAMVRSIPAGSSWTATIKHHSMNTRSVVIGAGIVLYESGTGKAVTYFHYSFDSSFGDTAAVTGWTTFNSGASALASTVSMSTRPNYMRLKKNSATSWTVEYSFDGYLWWTHDAARNLSGSFTSAPDQIGLVCRNGGAGGGASFEWFRVR